jgi:polar amino acid transport system substrate-binding protein
MKTPNIPSTLILCGLWFLLTSCGGTPNQGITTIADAEHAKIGVMTGSTGEVFAKQRFPEAQLKSFDDIMDAVAAMKAGQLDGLITATSSAIQIGKKNPDLTMLPDQLTQEDTAIGLRKGDDQLLAAINQIIASLKQDGTFDDMKRRWFKPDLSPYEEPDIEIPRQGQALRVGVAATREPFNFVDKDGRVTGHDGELARIFANRLNRPLEFMNMKFSALIPALQSGKVDLIVTGMSATEERKKFINFSDSYFANSQVLLVKAPGASTEKPATGRMVSPADLKDKTIGVLLGSIYDAWATKTYPQATIRQYRAPADTLLAVKTGKVDASIYPEAQLRVLMRENPEIGVLGESLFSFAVGAGFNKESTALLQQFNAFLADIKKNGVYADMVMRWIETGQTAMPALDAPTPNGVLVVGVSATGAPFDFIQDNQIVGFDIELVKRFGASIGKEVRLSDMEFGGLIAASAAKKIDMIVSSMAITEERKKRINFSDPYYDMGNHVYALKSNIAAYGNQSATTSGKPSFLDSVANSFRSNILEEKRYLLLWDGLKTTVLLSILSTAFGTLLGALICFLRMSSSPWLNGPARLYITVLRGMPVLVLLMLIFYVVFASVAISPVLVAVIAFGMNFGAYASEIFRTGIEGIDKGQTEAGIAMGFTPLQSFLYIVLPQTVQRILPVYKGEFISLVKMTSIVGYIAVQDLTKASDIIRSRTFDAFFPLIMVAVLYFAISWVLMQSLQYVERRTDPRYKRKNRGVA